MLCPDCQYYRNPATLCKSCGIIYRPVNHSIFHGRCKKCCACDLCADPATRESYRQARQEAAAFRRKQSQFGIDDAKNEVLNYLEANSDLPDAWEDYSMREIERWQEQRESELGIKYNVLETGDVEIDWGVAPPWEYVDPRWRLRNPYGYL